MTEHHTILGGKVHVYLIVLSELIEYLNDPSGAAIRQRAKYE
jgi:hypothetical protein